MGAVERRSDPIRNAWRAVAVAVAAVGLSIIELLVAHHVRSARVADSRRPSAARVLDTFSRLPLAFEANRGQADRSVDFISRGRNFEVMLDRAGATFLTAAAADKAARKPGQVSRRVPERSFSTLRMNFYGASAGSGPQALERLPGVSNYYIGNDPSRWQKNLSTYRCVRYAETYPGIDLAYHGDRGRLEFDFEVRPGADPRRIAIDFSDLARARMNPDGSTTLTGGAGGLTLKRPIAWQQIGGARREVRAQYKIAGNSNHASDARITIALDDYDHSQPLTIDPLLVFSTYFGGSVTEINGTGIDSSGNVYVTGWAFDGCPECTSFPTTVGPAYKGDDDAFVAEVSADGTTLLYSTLIGGSGFDEGTAIAARGDGNSTQVAGFTNSSDFPVTTGPAAPGDGDVWVAKFDNTGAVTAATYLGGSGFDEPSSIAIAQGCSSNCAAYVAGHTLSSSFSGVGRIGNSDAFVTELDTNLASVYTVLLGGNTGPAGAGTGNAFATGIAVDSGGSAYLTGGTDASDFPTTEGPGPAGSTDAFVAKLNTNGSVAFARRMGGSDYDHGLGVALKPACAPPCNPYVAGVTFSKDFAPISGGVVDSTLTSTATEFVAELSTDGSTALYSTFLGAPDGSTIGAVNGIAVDSAGDAYAVGSTESASLGLNSAVEGFPGPNGALYQFTQVGPSPTPTPAAKLNWPPSFGSPLTIAQSNGMSSAAYVGTTTGLFVSSDGINFSQAPAVGLPSGAVRALQVDGPSPLGAFAGGPQGLYVSTDLGNTFAATALTNQSVLALADLTGTSVSNTMLLAGTLNGLWDSTDGGANFAQVASVPAGAEVFSLVGNGKGNAPTTAFLGTSRGVFTSSDVIQNFPGTWAPTNLTSFVVPALTSDRNSSPVVDYAGTLFAGVFESTDNFNSFIPANIPALDISARVLESDNGSSPSTVFAGITSLRQASLYVNTSGYGGTFVATNLVNQPGTLSSIGEPFAGAGLQSHPVIAEINPTGSQVLFSTYLGGTSEDEPGGIAVDPAGVNIYVAGTTYSSDFPIEPKSGATPVDPTYGNFSSGFIAKIEPAAGLTAIPSPTPTPTSSATPAATPTAAPSATPTAAPTSTPTATPTPTPTPSPEFLTITPSSVNFPNVGTDTSATVKIELKNIGKAKLVGTVSNIGLSGTPFSIKAGSGAFSLGHNKSRTVTIKFAPTAPVESSGTITVASNDPINPAVLVSVSGTGEPGTLSVSPTTLNFPDTKVGKTTSLKLTIGNTGLGVLHVSLDLSKLGAAFSATAPSSFSLADKKSKVVKVKFKPTAAGMPTGTIMITSDGSAPSGASVSAMGTAQ